MIFFVRKVFILPLFCVDNMVNLKLIALYTMFSSTVLTFIWCLSVPLSLSIYFLHPRNVSHGLYISAISTIMFNYTIFNMKAGYFFVRFCSFFLTAIFYFTMKIFYNITDDSACYDAQLLN